jgi:hypothetical protein
VRDTSQRDVDVAGERLAIGDPEVAETAGFGEPRELQETLVRVIGK